MNNVPPYVLNQYARGYSQPWGTGLNMSNAKMPAQAQVKTQAPVPATADGIAQIKRAVEKFAKPRGLGDVEFGAGPQQMQSALNMLGQARALVNPTATLKEKGISQGDFDAKLEELAKSKDEKYNFSSMKKNPKLEAIISGLVGATGGGLAGNFVGGDLKSSLIGAAIGGLGGAGYGGYRASKSNKDLLATAKVLKEYGLLQPEYLRKAKPLLTKLSSQNSNKQRTSSAGESSGVSYKMDTDGHATGSSAFSTLDSYMKKAGLNSFQANFFGRLIEAGLDEQQIKQAVDVAEEKFGADVGSELREALEKKAWLGAVAAGARALLPTLFRQGAKQVATQGAKQLATQGAKQVATQGAKQVAKNVGTQAVKETAKRTMPQAVKQTAKKLLPQTAKQLGGRATLGGVTGAVNPYTGIGSTQSTAYNPDGSINWGNLATSTLGGAGLGAVGGTPVQRMAATGLAGEGLGALGGAGYSAITGDTANILENMQRGSQIGFGLGAAGGSPVANRLGAKAGLRSNAISKGIQALDPAKAVQNVGGAALKKLPAGTLPALGVGGAGMVGLNNIRGDVAKGKQQAMELIQENADAFRRDIAPTLDNIDNFTTNPLGTIFGGGEGGEGFSGMLGNIGNYIKENPWMVPLLLGGGGAALGGLMGGGRGAALGGFGGLSLPILMALSQGKDPTFGLGNLIGKFTGNQQDAEGGAIEQAVQPQQPGAPNPSAPVAPAPVDEVARQEVQQALANNQEGQQQGQGQ